MASKAKIEELKKISRDRYEEDGGTTYECCSDEDLARMIDDAGGSVKRAWKQAVMIYNIGRENAACYDVY